MAFSFKRTITIDPTKVGGSDLTNFPVLVSGTYSYLATVANGGKVQNSSGFDVGFYSDAALTTKLDWEIELYTAATGVVVYWVRVPAVSASVDTVFYMAYGDASISTDQSNKTGVWDANYNGVWHFPNGSSLGALDSTGNANNGSITGASAASAQIDGGAEFHGGTDGIDFGSASTVQPTSLPITISCWAKMANVNTGYNLFSTSGTNLVYAGYLLSMTGGSGAVEIGIGSGLGISSPFRRSKVGGSVTANAWTYLVGVFRGSTDMTIYVNASDVGGSYSGSGAAASNSGNAQIGQTSWGNVAYVGFSDEVRLSTIERSAGWVTGEYNNQSSPSTFYSVGSEVGSLVFTSTPIVQPMLNPIKVVGY